MKFLNLEKKEYKNYAKKFRNTYVGGRLYNIFRFFLEFAALNIICSFILEVFLEKETSVYGTIIFWIMCVGALISYYTYFRYLKEYVEKQEK